MNKAKFTCKLDCDIQSSHGLRRLKKALDSIGGQSDSTSLDGSQSEPVMDDQEGVMGNNLKALQKIHSNMIRKRVESGLSTNDFASRLGITQEHIIEIEEAPLNAPIWLLLLYLMGVGDILSTSAGELRDWQSLHPRG